MYQVYTGKQRSLIFPIMCNGFATLSYSDNIPGDVKLGVWDIEGSFTFETIVTPYEINGYQSESNNAPPSMENSQKIYPKTFATTSESEGEIYLPKASRKNHEMMIFYNDNFQISLVNDSTILENSPAKYFIRTRIKVAANNIQVVDTPVVISASTSHQYSFTTTNLTGENLPTDFAAPSIDANISGFNSLGQKEFDLLAVADSVNTSFGTTTIGIIQNSGRWSGQFPITQLFVGQELFIRSGTTYTSIGTVASVSSSDFTIVTNTELPSPFFDLFVRSRLEPTYINNSFHIACTYNGIEHVLELYINGLNIKRQELTVAASSDRFSFSSTDCFIGSNGTGSYGANSATTNKQFMGELHELAISNTYKNKINGLTNLLPNLDSTMLYLRFEEVDE
tara:strand:- start:7957 stop:9141 length:1185 start_codon:yes stop_codon:yes gene_type:complete